MINLPPKELTKLQWFMIAVLAIVTAAGVILHVAQHYQSRTPLVQMTANNFKVGLELAKMQWLQSDHREGFLDLDGDDRPDTRFNQYGYPIGITANGIHPLSQLQDGGIAANDACAQILKHVSKNNTATMIVADEKGECASGDFCVKASGKHKCIYLHRLSKEKIIYHSVTGKITL